MPKQNVLVLFNEPLLPKNHPDADSEHAVVDMATDLAKKIESGGYKTSMFSLGQDPSKLWRTLTRRKIDVVLNLFEGNVHLSETESYVAGLLEWSGIPYTGSPFSTLTIARMKHVAKYILRGAGLPVCDFFVADSADVETCPLAFPVIVKPAQQDASVGIDQASVCTDLGSLRERLGYIIETYGAPALVEEYIPGRELNVAMLALPDMECLPPAEILFPPQESGYWPILTYDGKWRPGTPDYETLPPKYPADLSPKLIRQLEDAAKQTFRVLGCRDYARIDFRLRPDGRFFVLEANPNPEISDEAGFAGCLGAAQIPHKEFVVRLIEHALTRRSVFKPTFLPAPRLPATTPRVI